MAVFMKMGGVLVQANKTARVEKALKQAKLTWRQVTGGTLDDHSGQAIYFCQYVFEYYGLQKKAQDIIDKAHAGTNCDQE